MNKLITVNIEQFKSITMEDCLNYTPDKKLESLVGSCVSNSLKILKSNKQGSATKEDRVKFLLQHVLLKASANTTWITTRDKSNLDQLYLYTVIRKHLFIMDPNFFN